jgi:hypothetical protein
VRGFVLLLTVCLLAQRSLGVIVKLADLQTMAQQSDAILHGRVGDQQTLYDQMGRLITLTEVEVIDDLYGVKSKVVTIYQVGGELKGVVMPLLGGHSYRFGQEIIFFGLSLKDTLVSFGVGQGKFDINPHNSDEKVREDLGSVATLEPYVAGSLGVFAASPLSFFSVDTLKDEIRLMLKNRPKSEESG